MQSKMTLEVSKHVCAADDLGRKSGLRVTIGDTLIR